MNADRRLHRCWLSGLFCALLAVAAACSDSGTIPALGPDETLPAPAPDGESPTEPFLELTPELLRFDAAGNALDAERLTIRTNCAWQLELPDAPAWIHTVSARAGVGSGSVRFGLYMDGDWHETEGRVTAASADGGTTLVRSFTLRQGTPPESEESGTPEEPDASGDAADPQPPADPESPETPDDPETPGPDVPDAAARCDDFAALAADARFMRQVGPTPAGWSAEHAAVHAGGAYDSEPVYGSLLGSDRGVRGLCLSGNRTAPGRLFSPELTGGCGTLTFAYGTTRTGDERVDLTVELTQNGAVVRTFRVQAEVAKLQRRSCELEVQLSGTFRITIANNCPSGAAQERDGCTVFGIAWTPRTDE